MTEFTQPIVLISTPPGAPRSVKGVVTHEAWIDVEASYAPLGSTFTVEIDDWRYVSCPVEFRAPGVHRIRADLAEHRMRISDLPEGMR